MFEYHHNPRLDAPTPFEGVGTVTVYQYLTDTTTAVRAQRFENILFDQVGTHRTILELVTVDENLIHVPNVAYYTVQPNLSGE